MRTISKERFSAANVLIEFQDGPVSFRVRHEATIAEISEIVDGIATWHGGAPMSIDVRFKSPNDGDGRRHCPSLISSPISRTGSMPQANHATSALRRIAVEVGMSHVLARPKHG